MHMPYSQDINDKTVLHHFYSRASSTIENSNRFTLSPKRHAPIVGKATTDDHTYLFLVSDCTKSNSKITGEERKKYMNYGNLALGFTVRRTNFLPL